MMLVFDIGKTNKKCFVFDEAYRIIFEKTSVLPETEDEDGFPCDDLDALTGWVRQSLQTVLSDRRFAIRAVNCTAYGASFVYLDAGGNPLTPLYNYLKPYPDALKQKFFRKYGGAKRMALETASPDLGSLNSGLQLYRLKKMRPGVFSRIRYALHLPQYIAWLLHGVALSELTSIGCHTMLWDFRANAYHRWVDAEGIDKKFPPLAPSTTVLPTPWPGSGGGPLFAGTGLHDSSAALIPYLAHFPGPFVLLSTGTWCISLHPFSADEPILRPEELARDCLCYLSFEGKAVKAARYFGGHEHEQAVTALAAEYGVPAAFFQSPGNAPPGLRGLYSAFLRGLVEKQAVSTRLAIGRTPAPRLYVDGGFSKNEGFMTLLAAAFPEMEVFAAEVAQATALGAALAIHRHWNEKPVPEHLITVKQYRL